MRERHIIIAVLILLGLGVKAISFTARTAEAASRSKGIAIGDVSRIHQNIRSLPDESFHDMTLVFPVFRRRRLTDAVAYPELRSCLE